MVLQALIGLLARPLGFVLPNDGQAGPAHAHEVPGLPGLPIPLGLLTDSYKTTHYRQYPGAVKMVAYGECRKPFNGDTADQRVVVYGMRYIIDQYIAQQWTMQDYEQLQTFMSTHNAGKTPFPFPSDLILKFIKENNGYFPVKIEALPEGTVCYPHTPIFQITAAGEYSPLVTYLETLLTMIWVCGDTRGPWQYGPVFPAKRFRFATIGVQYPTAVATLSRKAHTRIKTAFERSVDDDAMFLLESRLHDFGFRGCTSVEQSVRGGAAHLLNFTGSDTLSASFYVQFHLNKGKPVAESIPATEHSVMTAFASEKAAIDNMIGQYGSGVFACVMDSYDYVRALSEVLPAVAKHKTEKGGFMVLRPDSGDPIQAVLQALQAAERIFGVTVNKKGFKIPNGVGVIHGDGIELEVITRVLQSVMDAGFSAQCVAFGMGAGLLQKVNRDTMSFATKLCFIKYSDGTERNVMKTPKTDESKYSLPGLLAVKRNDAGVPTVYPASLVSPADNILETVYDNGPVYDSTSTATVTGSTSSRLVKKRRSKGKSWPTFDETRTKVTSEWNALPPQGNAISYELQALIESTRAEQTALTEASLKATPAASGEEAPPSA